MGKEFTYYVPQGEWPLFLEPYTELMKSLGGIPGNELSDLLLLSGGSDFGTRPDRDSAETDAYHEYTRRGSKILGICRGAQLHCVLSGGTLIEHLPEWNNSLMHTTLSGDWTGLSSFHSIINEEGKSLLINSRHHQGFIGIPNSKTIWRSRDGLSEGGVDDKCLWTQWHPEFPDMTNTIAQHKFKNDFYDWFWK